MPFISFQTPSPDVIVGLWEIQEDEMFFLTQLKLYEHEWTKLSKISHPRKRLEWLSSRLCLKEILNISHLDRVQSLSQHNGKPYLSNYSHFISYTHSQDYSAAIASPFWEVGIDLESLSMNRNMKTRFLFMDEAELAYFDQYPTLTTFLLIWSTKETLYKISGISGLSFKEGIHLCLDNQVIEENGTIQCCVQDKGNEKRYTTYYALDAGYVLTYAFDTLSEAQVIPAS